jgi:hypothetical protein
MTERLEDIFVKRYFRRQDFRMQQSISLSNSQVEFQTGVQMKVELQDDTLK